MKKKGLEIESVKSYQTIKFHAKEQTFFSNRTPWGKKYSVKFNQTDDGVIVTADSLEDPKMRDCVLVPFANIIAVTYKSGAHDSAE